MKRSEYAEQKWKFSQMDPDFIVDTLRISSLELLQAFPAKFEEFLKDEYQREDEQENNGEAGYGRSYINEDSET